MTQRKGKWIKPPRGTLKMNIDVRKFSDGNTGLGCVVRDRYGEVILAATTKVEEDWPPDIAEGRAVIFGLKLAAEKGLGPLIIKSDCLKLINLLNGKKVNRQELEKICAEICYLAACLEGCSWSFCYREANNIDHLLAHYNHNDLSSICWTEAIPSWIADIAANEADLVLTHLL